MIKEYRKKRGYTQEQLAEILAISTRQLQRVENKEKEISMGLFKKVVKALEISDEDIISFIKNISTKGIK